MLEQLIVPYFCLDNPPPSRDKQKNDLLKLCSARYKHVKWVVYHLMLDY